MDHRTDSKRRRRRMRKSVAKERRKTLTAIAEMVQKAFEQLGGCGDAMPAILRGIYSENLHRRKDHGAA